MQPEISVHKLTCALLPGHAMSVETMSATNMAVQYLRMWAHRNVRYHIPMPVRWLYFTGRAKQRTPSGVRWQSAGAHREQELRPYKAHKALSTPMGSGRKPLSLTLLGSHSGERSGYHHPGYSGPRCALLRLLWFSHIGPETSPP